LNRLRDSGRNAKCAGHYDGNLCKFAHHLLPESGIERKSLR
jgi:hypothetical protein